MMEPRSNAGPQAFDLLDRAPTWTLSYRADPEAKQIADRHYNRQNPDSPQFVPPGRCLVLRRPGAVWVTSWPLAEYVRHQWPGAWINSCFRRESGPLASDLQRDVAQLDT